MARKKPPTYTKVESIRHKDKRTNIPTEELRDFIADDEQAPEDDALPPRPVARPAARLARQGRARPPGLGRPRGADLHPGEDPSPGDHR